MSIKRPDVIVGLKRPFNFRLHDFNVSYTFTDELTPLENIYALWEKIKDIVETFEDLEIVINQMIDFLEGEGIEIHVISTLEKWLEDGTLEHIINKSIIEGKVDVDVFESEVSKIYNKIGLLEEMFVSVKKYGAKGDGVTDDTEAFKVALKENKGIYVPIGKYIVKDTIVLENGSFMIGASSQMNAYYDGGSEIIYDGDVDNMKALIQLGKGKVGGLFENDGTNITLKNIALDGNKKCGFGVYGTYLTNETVVESVMAKQFKEYGFFFAKSWYARYENLLAKFNENIGLSFGDKIHLSSGDIIDNGGDYTMNGCFIQNIRSHTNGTMLHNKEFKQTNSPLGSGIVLCGGSGFNFKNFLSEKSGGYGVYVSPGSNQVFTIQDGYIEASNFKTNTPVDKITGLYIDMESDYGTPIYVSNLFFSEGNGGGINVNPINKTGRSVIFENIARPKFYNFNGLERLMELRNCQNASYNVSRNTESLSVRGDLAQNKTDFLHNSQISGFYYSVYIKRVGETSDSIGLELVNGTRTSRNVKGIGHGEMEYAFSTFNIKYLYTSPVVSDGGKFEIEIYRHLRTTP